VTGRAPGSLELDGVDQLHCGDGHDLDQKVLAESSFWSRSRRYRSWGHKADLTGRWRSLVSRCGGCGFASHHRHVGDLMI
jgi:hypothetical protein